MNRRPVDPRSTMRHPRDIEPAAIRPDIPTSRLIAWAVFAIGLIGLASTFVYTYANDLDMTSSPDAFSNFVLFAVLALGSGLYLKK